ncbi:MAG: hypothetical protein OEV44_13380, partial [Spirochaetota bacterium]|nr:hypothetical protein [Spirochaetota bacterium]
VAISKNIKYYKNRVRSSNLYSWEYLNPVSEKEIDAQNIYFAVSYDENNKIRSVKFPFYVKSRSGKLTKGESIELYRKDEKINQRINYIDKKYIGTVKFKYNKNGKLHKEEYYADSMGLLYKQNGKNSKDKSYKVAILQYYFVYDYRGNKLIKKSCYNGENKEPLGEWLYLNDKGKIIKKEIYELNDENKGILNLTTNYTFNPQGKLKTEKSYSDGKPFGNWFYYDDQGKIIRKEVYNELLIRYYKYFYFSSGNINKVEFYENNKLSETVHYDENGKITKREIPK